MRTGKGIKKRWCHFLTLLPHCACVQAKVSKKVEVKRAEPMEGRVENALESFRNPSEMNIQIGQTGEDPPEADTETYQSYQIEVRLFPSIIVTYQFKGGQPRPSTTLVRLGHNAAVLGVPIGHFDV
jgi:hypothetical protein